MDTKLKLKIKIYNDYVINDNLSSLRNQLVSNRNFLFTLCRTIQSLMILLVFASMRSRMAGPVVIRVNGNVQDLERIGNVVILAPLCQAKHV